MAERIDIGNWLNPITRQRMAVTYVDDGVCDICHESSVVVALATPSALSGRVCVKCIMDGLELFAIKNNRKMPVLTYKDTLSSKTV